MTRYLIRDKESDKHCYECGMFLDEDEQMTGMGICRDCYDLTDDWEDISQ